MNILLINHYAGSLNMGMEYRPYYLAKEWVDSGHNVTIVAASFSHLRSRNPEVEKDIQEEIIDGIRYIWLKTSPYAGNGVGRIRNMLQFIWRLRRYVTKQLATETIDAVIASSTYPLDIYTAHKVQKQHNARFIFEVHDLWPLSPMELGNIPAWHPYIMLMQKAENDAYRFCDYVVSILPCAKEHMLNHGLQKNKFVHIPNGINLADWDYKTPLDNELLHVVRENSKENMIICYAGNHSIGNALGVLINAANMLKDEPVFFLLIGPGPERNNINHMINMLNLKKVLCYGPVPKTSIPDLLASVDVCYIGMQKQPLFRFGVSPNKLMDYMMSAKPIIYAVEAGNDPVKEAGCGISVPPEDPEAIADAIRQLAGMSQSERENMGLRGRDYVLKNHDYRVIARRFLEVLECE